MAQVSAPSTLQAVIAARIPRPSARRQADVYSAAAVIGISVRSGDAEDVGHSMLFWTNSVQAELVDQIGVDPTARVRIPAFADPRRGLRITAQIGSRAQLHRRLAQAPIAPVDQNAALIAKHLEAAGDLHGAYMLHMRAGAWSGDRDIAAAQSAGNARAGRQTPCPLDDRRRAPMRITP